ncbi:hypothetical protein KCP74_08850 [Salmonella enterica subsp. enterica]|nr:hypothetical protein KCP74_08850 [Salmonella enterica subsp. enterica]
MPATASRSPVWLLGSSLYSAANRAPAWSAVRLLLPHFAPDMLFRAPHLYRTQFKPSARLKTVRWCV